MKKNIISAGLLTAGLMLILMVLYPVVIWCVAQATPNNGKGFVTSTEDERTCYVNIGQSFTKEGYFWGRPSAVDYNAAGSGASNKGTNNREYLKEVEERLDAFLQRNPDIKREEVPVDLLTASGSGLDPHISVQAAMVQIARVSKARKMDKKQLEALVNAKTEKALMGLFGPEKINVVMLNAALDKMNKK